MNFTPGLNILDQVDGEWERLFMLLLWVVSQDRKITITAADIEGMLEFFPDAVLYTHGHEDSMDFQLVTKDEAMRLAILHRGKVKGL